MKVGDIVKMYAPVAGYKKYHFCVCLPEDEVAGRFLFLNSDPSYRDCLSIDCARIPDIPASDTGVTAISFSLLPRYNQAKLNVYQAEVVGTMPADVVAEMLEFLDGVRSLPKGDKECVREALEFLNEQNA
ncbi:hypothetical protein [uncultured Roseibium sp.]|uniref:hypothetical protein n=1 Tax=uncultured Roseibium sp. TaxID=1936171 RepID=UPI0026194BEF|nr:hypothetical protein [uncultured Roseibium sp.]